VLPYACGIVLGHLLPVSLWVSGGIVVSLSGAGLFFSLRRTPCITPGLWIPFLLLLALGAFKLGIDRSGTPLLADSISYSPAIVNGTIADPVVITGRRARFTLRSTSYCWQGRSFPFDALIAATFVLKHGDTCSPGLDYGATVVLTGVLSPPSPERNPGEFSPKQYEDAAGIAATIFVRGMENLRIADTSGGFWPMKVLVVSPRKWILRLIDRTVGGEEGEFLKGLLIGDRSGIPAETKQAFVDSGVAHVLAVSGSNVAVVALVLVFLYDFVRLPRRWRPLVISAGLLWYMFLTGSQPPVVRATIMALVVLSGGAIHRPTNAYNALGVAALVILLLDARQLFDVGFQLSFGAVLSIIHLYPRWDALIWRLPRRRRWQRASAGLLRLCAVSLAATMGTLPLTAMSFGKFSVVGILANLPVVPATGVSVILGAAGIVTGLVSPGAAAACGAVNGLVLRLTLDVAGFCASAPFAFVETFGFTWSHACAFYLLLALVVHWREKRIVRTALFLLLLFLNVSCAWALIFPDRREGGVLRLHCIDVGQGDALLVEFPEGKTMLIDGGPRSGPYDAGALTVGPYLKRRGITRIDLLLVTHPHDDHIGGISFLLRHFEVGKVIDSGQPLRSEIYASYLKASSDRSSPRKGGEAGELLSEFPSARLYLLAPGKGFTDPDTSHRPPNLNNTSLVVKLQYGTTSFLLAGDAEEDAEAVMVDRFGEFLKSDVLKSGHHGSITGSSARFLDVVRPSVVIVSVGRNNKFRHPSQEVIGRYQFIHAEVMRTDREGAVILASDGKCVRKVTWRTSGP
jgi:competence protein ComEC